VQRLFTSFPDGWPGIGLLILRCSVVPELLGPILPPLFGSGLEPPIIHLSDMFALLVGASLLLGFLTPLAAIVGGIFTLFELPLLVGASSVYRNCETAHVLALALSIATIGPGAYSIDGRIFGRREIIVPPYPPSIEH
jgi:hypothetical protein